MDENKIEQGITVDYNKYMQSSQWKRLREYKIEQAQYACEWCGITKWSVPLEVHHRTYKRLGRERLDDLLVLCKECHEKAHGGTKKSKPNSTKKMKWKDYVPFDRAMQNRHGTSWNIRLSSRTIDTMLQFWKDNGRVPGLTEISK